MICRDIWTFFIEVGAFYTPLTFKVTSGLNYSETVSGRPVPVTYLPPSSVGLGSTCVCSGCCWPTRAMPYASWLQVFLILLLDICTAEIDIFIFVHLPGLGCHSPKPVSSSQHVAVPHFSASSAVGWMCPDSSRNTRHSQPCCRHLLHSETSSHHSPFQSLDAQQRQESHTRGDTQAQHSRWKQVSVARWGDSWGYVQLLRFEGLFALWIITSIKFQNAS